jgi:hypothetical protein
VFHQLKRNLYVLYTSCADWVAGVTFECSYQLSEKFYHIYDDDQREKLRPYFRQLVEALRRQCFIPDPFRPSRFILKQREDVSDLIENLDVVSAQLKYSKNHRRKVPFFPMGART